MARMNRYEKIKIFLPPPSPLQTPLCPLQIALLVLQGDRPEVPPREALPGPDTAAFVGMDAYVQLMR